MSVWTQVTVSALACFMAAWVSYGRGHRWGYLLALDHLEEMIRPKLLGCYEPTDAIAKLREESGQRQGADK